MHEKRLALNRRTLLMGLGAAAGAAIPSAGISTTPTRRWDRETDIICVGGGAAGCTAAVIAAANGSDVTLVEKAPILGGTSRKSGGATWIPNHFLLRSQGVEDRKADCLRYMARFAFPQFYAPDSPTLGLDTLSYRLLEAFYDHGAPMIDRLRQLGVMDFEQHTLGANGALSPDYAEHLPENKAGVGRSLVPLDALGRTMAKRGGRGSRLIDAMETWLTHRGTAILTEHRATRLIMEDDRCSGLEVQHGERAIRLRARQGVIFGSGGFAHNPELLRLHHPFAYGSCAVPQATGDFVELSTAAGARMGSMSTAWRTQVVLEEALANPVLGRGVYLVPADSMILVNKYGRRVVNEKRNYNDRTRAHFTYDPTTADYPNQLLFMIFDARARKRFAGSYPIPGENETGYLIEGETIERLTANLQARLQFLKDRTGGVALASEFSATLSNTVHRFNEFAAKGRDLDFDRGLHEYDRAWGGYFSVTREGEKPNTSTPNETMHPLANEGPYYALILAPGVLDTSGGPQIDARARVLGADGRPIAGLYGAGNCVASPSRDAYFGGGGTIGLAMTFGYIAAMNASGKA